METFNSKYGSLYKDWEGYESQHQYDRLERLVLSYNKNLRTEVIKAKEKYNLKIRSLISDKTGLNLSFPYDKNRIEKRTITVEVEDRVPSTLLDIFKAYDDSIIELLLHYRQLQATISELEFQLNHLKKFTPLYKGDVESGKLNEVLNHLIKLVEVVEKSDILTAIQRLDPDILGAYFLQSNRVELYWLPIGLLSLINNMSVEDFTIVVLTHELVHGYTHIGFDKDGNHWDTVDFGNSDLVIVEGFAQLYTDMICKDYFDSAGMAFETLLNSQRPEYTVYKLWHLNDGKNNYEKARQILLRVRAKCCKNYNDFNAELRRLTEF